MWHLQPGENLVLRLNVSQMYEGDSQPGGVRQSDEPRTDQGQGSAHGERVRSPGLMNAELHDKLT